MAHEDYKPFTELLVTHIMAAAPIVSHAILPSGSDQPGSPVTAPVTECLFATLPASHSETEYDANVEKFKEGVSKVPGNQATGIVTGWTVERKIAEDGSEEKVFAAFVGWPSVEAHLELRNNADFSQIIAPLREGPKKIEICHVAFTKFE